jgi:hypothetical protein
MEKPAITVVMTVRISIIPVAPLDSEALRKAKNLFPPAPTISFLTVYFGGVFQLSSHFLTNHDSVT